MLKLKLILWTIHKTGKPVWTRRIIIQDRYSLMWGGA